MTGVISWEDMQPIASPAPQSVGAAPLISWEDMASHAKAPVAAVATVAAPQPETPSLRLQRAFESGDAGGVTPPPDSLKNSPVGGFVRGMRDVPDSGAQLITRAIEALAPAGTDFEKWAKSQREGVEGINKNAEMDYLQNWRQGQDPGIDPGRIAGNIVASMPLAGAGGAAARGGGMLARAADAAGTGAAVGALSSPVADPNNFWRDKLNQAEIGMVGGVAGNVAGNVASRVVNPNATSNAAVQKLIDEGISLTPGQVLGGGAKEMEDKLTSFPLFGAIIKGGRSQGYDDLNRAVVGRVLGPLGEDLPDNVKTGRDAISYAQGRIKEAYSNLLPGLKISVDPQFSTDVHNLQSMATAGLTPDLANQFDGFLQNQVVGKLAPSGTMDGITLKEIESEIGNEAQNFLHSASASERKYGTALGALQDSLRGLVQRSNPDAADQLSKINQAYGYMKILEKAGGTVGAPSGVFTPAQLQSAVKASDRTSNDRAFAAGNARLQDLSDAARSVLPSTIPDSGTAGRLGPMALMGMVAKEAHEYLPDFLSIPAIAGAGAYGAAAGAYSRPGMKSLATLLARRGPGAAGIAETIRAYAPYAGAGAAGLTPGFAETR